MTLQIIGAGFGRTGTSSVRSALSVLGYPCYHMFDLLFAPEARGHLGFWRDLVGRDDVSDVDWSTVFADYKATIDFPAAPFWRELSEAYPEAKVLLTHHVRGAGAWYDSTYETIYAEMKRGSESSFGRTFIEMMNGLVWNGMLQGVMEDREAAIALYRAHTEEVRDTIPAERLLVLSADEGWEPLCAFLGHQMPEEPFPRSNDRDAMNQMLSRLQAIQRFSSARSA